MTADATSATTTAPIDVERTIAVLIDLAGRIEAESPRARGPGVLRALRSDVELLRNLAAQVGALVEAQRTVGFFASVIKSGEPWTDECEKALRAALGASR